MEIGRIGRRAAGIAAAALALTAGGARAAAAAVCAFPSAPRVIVSEGARGAKGARLVQVWDVADATVYWTQSDPSGQAYRDFAARVAGQVKVTDPVSLLRTSPAGGDSSARQNNSTVATRATEWLRPAGCLEKLLLSVQHARVGLFDRPTEFAALVLHSPNGRRLRIYYMTDNEDGIAAMAPLTAPALRDIRAGWRADVVLRNHSFRPGQPNLDGILAPTEADARFAAGLAAYRLKEAWITNGVHTSRIPSAALGLFVPPPVKASATPSPQGSR